MAEVRLTIGGRSHMVACRDGEEAALEALGRRLDSHSAVAMRAAGAQGGERTLLYIALMLADELGEAERAGGGAGVSSVVLDRIAGRLEALAGSLEKSAANA
ncbi:cell division protein ZapA [Sphingomonas sp.]|uniref:cell division protein ZapA n=1 Tax=Sphingomonas sp. TaxID=28214 RepID=UPI002DD65A00|nr:cell division protein ZapA [Sphingomonas sp.]